MNLTQVDVRGRRAAILTGVVLATALLSASGHATDLQPPPSKQSGYPLMTARPIAELPSTQWAGKAPPASAFQTPPPTTDRWLSEVRLGVMAHDPVGSEKGTADINGEVLFNVFRKSGASFWDVLVPRAHVGATGNLSGKTSFVYAGFAWTYDIVPWLFVEGAFGGAVHNGPTGPTAPPGLDALGCNPLFHESMSIGFLIAPQWSVMATTEHISNGFGCYGVNKGLTNTGVRVGYRF